MDYGKAAKAVYEQIGGRDNIISAAHCATRLRLVIADNSKCDKTRLEEIDGVKGVFEASGQLQIIFGTGTVNKVYDEFIRLAGKSDNKLVNLISKPGLMLQHLTTREPDAEMAEVAIAAVEAVFDWRAYLNENFGYTYPAKTEKKEHEEP